MMAGPVYVAFPTANMARAKATLARWHGQGYRSIVYVDPDVEAEWLGPTQIVIGAGSYPGYYVAQNHLARLACAMGAGAVVLAGDDMDPDPNLRADQILQECRDHAHGELFVMQPCGDPQGMDETCRPAAARICGSPWVGRDYVRCGYGGEGPFWSGYMHFYGDEELKSTAEANAVLWMRPDLTQFHHHWSFGHGAQAPYQKRNSDLWWGRDKALFMARRLAGWPGSALAPM